MPATIPRLLVLWCVLRVRQVLPPPVLAHPLQARVPTAVQGATLQASLPRRVNDATLLSILPLLVQVDVWAALLVQSLLVGVKLRVSAAVQAATLQALRLIVVHGALRVPIPPPTLWRTQAAAWPALLGPPLRFGVQQVCVPAAAQVPTTAAWGVLCVVAAACLAPTATPLVLLMQLCAFLVRKILTLEHLQPLPVKHAQLRVMLLQWVLLSVCLVWRAGIRLQQQVSIALCVQLARIPHEATSRRAWCVALARFRLDGVLPRVDCVALLLVTMCHQQAWD